MARRGRGEGGSTTVREVAQRAGVSTATVSRVLSGADRVRAETRARVLEAARALRFRPNRAARSLVRGDGGVVGIVVPDLRRADCARLAQAAGHRARAGGLLLAIADRTDPQQSEGQLTRDLGRRTDGLLLCSPDVPASAVAALADSIPIVLAHRRLGALPTVLVDERSRIARGMEYLRTLGHETITWVSAPVDAQTAAERGRALDAPEGARIDQIEAPGPRYADGRALTPALLSSGTTAVMAFDGELASGVVAGLREAGVDVPGRVSVIGGAPDGGARSNLTTLSPPFAEMGAAAMDLLRMALRGEAAAPALRTIRFDPHLEIRGSTGPPP